MFLLVILAASWSMADEKLIIDAQSTEHTAGMTVLKGNVRFFSPEKFLITADLARYNTDELSAELLGNVKIDWYTPGGVIEIASQKVIYYFNNSTGVFTDVEAQFGDSFHFSGEKMEQQEDGRFQIFKGTLTACNQANPQWSMKIQRATLEKEGYSKLSHSTFSIKGIPVFYFPFLILPTMQARRSGLLLPDTGNSQRNGTYLKIPLYLAPRDDWDLTLTPGYFDKSGMSLDAEVRYHTQVDKSGFIRGYALQDRVIANGPDSFEAGRKISNDRFRFGLHHQQNLGKGSLLIDAEQGSDYQVEWDFVEDINSGRIRNYFYHLWYGRSWRDQFFSIEIDRNEQIFADQTGIGEIQHLPSLSWVIPARHIGKGFFLKSNAHVDLFDHNYFNTNESSLALKYSIHSELKKTMHLGPYIFTNYGVAILASRLKGETAQLERKPFITAGTLEIFGPRLYKSLINNRFDHFITYGVDIHYNQIENPLPDTQLQFDDVDVLLGEQIQGLDTSWLVRSSVFSRSKDRSRPLLEVEMRKKVNTETRKSPLEIAVRIPGYKGFHLNSLIKFRTDENQFDLLSFYGSAVKGSWTGYAGFVKRQTGLNNQESFILRSDMAFPEYKSRLHVALDYDFLQNELKSQELVYKLSGQCMSFQVAYHETPVAGTSDTNQWYRLSVQFRNLGEVGSKF